MIEQQIYDDSYYTLVNDNFLVIELTREWKVQNTNERFLAFSRYSFDELLMWDYFKLMDWSQVESRKVMNTAIRGEQWQGESRFITKCGNVKWLESIFLPVFDKDGSLEKILTLHKDITDAKLAAHWKRLAYHNELTDLPNRRSLLEAMDFQICRASETDSRFAVLFMDLNNFKSVNDMYGHHTGDQLIVEISRRLTDLPYTAYEVFHMSGDEFIILLEDTTYLDAMIEHIMMIFDVGFTFGISRLNVSVSIGISLFPEHSTSAERLMQLADQAMYEAKNSAHNQYRYVDESFVALRE